MARRIGPPRALRTLSEEDAGERRAQRLAQKTSCALVSLVDKKLRETWWMICLLLVGLVAGCKSTTTSTTPSYPQPNKQPMAALSPLDPCPERLHDLAGALLNFMVQYGRLPPTLEDLSPVKGATAPVLSCPLTNEKYVYNPNGIKIAPNQWVIVHDAGPYHA